MSEDHVIVCLPWAMRPRFVVSVMRLCSCGAELALSSANVAAAESLGLRPVCFICLGSRLHAGVPLEFTAGLIEGELCPLEKAFRLALALRERN